MLVGSSPDVSKLVMEVNQAAEVMSQHKRGFEDARNRLLEASKVLCQSLQTPMEAVREMMCQVASLRVFLMLFR